jgi:hypothetical protein
MALEPCERPKRILFYLPLVVEFKDYELNFLDKLDAH